MSAALAPLLQCLAEQSAVLEKFVQALEDEAHNLLEASSNEQLIDLTQHKNAFAMQLAELEVQRTECLGGLGFDADLAGIEAACAAHPELQAPFDALFALAREASTLNAQNGQIITMFLASNQRAVDALRSLMGENLYNARGRLSKPATP
ncbi:flagellar protein FlgN [Alcaligenaceae bacterium CGII-47]|nr:flagellar protein FlgN [Alcaligenaceae bacterium CGII-47]